MGKFAIKIFVIEVLFLLLSLMLSGWFVGFHQEYFVQLLSIFVLIWMYAYSGKSISFEYFTHLLKVSLMYLVLGALCAAALQSWVFALDVMLSLCFWFCMAVLLRMFFRKNGRSILVGISHPALLNDMNSDSRVTIQSIDVPNELHVLKEKYDFVLVDKDFKYSDNWKNFLVHTQTLNIPAITLQEYEELLFGRIALKDLNHNWLQSGFRGATWYSVCKPLWEFVVVVMCLPLLLIMGAVVSLFILAKMGRPVFYVQKRVGKDGCLFKMYKFRTMAKTEGGEKFVTPLGEILRKYRLDELPQFLNILKCEMSLIGPRPEWVELSKKYADKLPLYPIRNLVKPGLTGWAQVRQGHVSNVEDTDKKVQYDLYYVKHVSLVLDLVILCRTVWTVLTGFGAK